MRVAINGFGRIGRTVFRLLNPRNDVTVVAINDLADPLALAYLLRHDTVMGAFPDRAQVEGDVLHTSHQTVRMLRVPELATLPWGELAVDVVIEATGVFRDRARLGGHLDAGARRVILTVPAKDEVDATVVLGVNDDQLRREHRIVSNASCTTNCLAPVAMVLDREFGIERGVMTTVHAYTNDQRLADVPHSDWRRSRAAAENTIPTTTGAARAVGKVLPRLAGKLDGMAMRVPVPDGSVVDLVTTLREPVTPARINEALRAAAATPRLERVLRYSEGPLVSSDIVGDPHSSIFDAPLTQCVGERVAKTLSWYDNEWGYSNRVVDLLEVFRGLGPPI
ncbi:MAG: type I glyceraldehyde-3-phosphate dehydrogenase [Deferrisomatales bacterium]|nr:type I glyceraldehyde-3-phosphate dehydrogenase [Deferrisomatales bacterium]